jgi:hypothetical protein
MPAPRAAKPIVIRQSAAPAKHKKRRSHGRRSAGGDALTPTRMFALMLGGAAVGFIQKQFPNLPSVPVVGKKGTIAIAGYLLAKRGGSLAHIARDVARAAAVLAGEELGRTGSISGDLAPQISGAVANQT